MYIGSRFCFGIQSSCQFDNFALDIFGELVDVELSTLDTEPLGKVYAAVLTTFSIAGGASATKD